MNTYTSGKIKITIEDQGEVVFVYEDAYFRNRKELRKALWNYQGTGFVLTVQFDEYGDILPGYRRNIDQRSVANQDDRR